MKRQSPIRSHGECRQRRLDFAELRRRVTKTVRLADQHLIMISASGGRQPTGSLAMRSDQEQAYHPPAGSRPPLALLRVSENLTAAVPKILAAFRNGAVVDRA